MQDIHGSPITWLMALALVALYFLPSIIGSHRRVRHGGLLFLGNLLFACTVLGWFILLAYACITMDIKPVPHDPFTARLVFPGRSQRFHYPWEDPDAP